VATPAEAGYGGGGGWGADLRATALNGGVDHTPSGSGRGGAAPAAGGDAGSAGRPAAAPARAAAAQGPAAAAACARAGLGSAYLDLDGRGGDPARRWMLPSDEDELGGGGGAPSASAAAHPGSAGQAGGGAPGRSAPAGAAGPASAAAEGAEIEDGPARGGPTEPAARPGADAPPPWQPVAATPAMELRRRREREAAISGKRGAPGGGGGGSVKVEPGVGHGRGGGGGGRGHGAAQRPSAAPDVKPALGALSAEMRLQAPPAVGLRAKSAPLEPAAHRAPAPTWLSSVLLRAGGGRGMRGPGSRARRHQRRRTGGSRARGRRVRPGPKSDPFSSRAQAWRRSCAGA